MDPRVIMINQIMYTFNKQGMFVVENKTRESWYWGASHFMPTLEHEYAGSLTLMLYDQVWTRVFKLVWLAFCFMCMSVINALFIRVAIKCSVLIIFPMIAC